MVKMAQKTRNIPPKNSHVAKNEKGHQMPQKVQNIPNISKCLKNGQKWPKSCFL